MDNDKVHEAYKALAGMEDQKVGLRWREEDKTERCIGEGRKMDSKKRLRNPEIGVFSN